MKFQFKHANDPAVVFEVEVTCKRDGEHWTPDQLSKDAPGAVATVYDIVRNLNSSRLFTAALPTWPFRAMVDSEPIPGSVVVVLKDGSWAVIPDQPDEPSPEVLAAIEGTAERWGNDIAQAIAEDREIEPDPVVEEAAKSARKKG